MSPDSSDGASWEVHVFSALDAAVSRWDEVSAEVAAATDQDDAVRRVAAFMALDEEQARAVLNLQLRRMAREDRAMIAERLATARAVAAEIPAPPTPDSLAERCESDPQSLRRNDFAVTRALPTRWSDDDTYGHVNNVVHYLMFDTAVNGWLIEASGTDVRRLPAIGLVVETGCRYLAELRFPETVTAGIGLEKVGTSSVVYRLALFGERSDAPAAVGRFVHVYVDRESRRPVPVPDVVRAALRTLA